MATIKNTITLEDRMSPILSKMLKAMESTIRGTEQMNKSSNHAFKQAKTDIQLATMELQNFSSSINSMPTPDKPISGFQKLKDVMMTTASTIYTVKQALQAVAKVADFSDQITLTEARIDLMNDGLQTTAELQDKIFQAAQRSRGSYMEMQSAVAKLGILAGDAFGSSEEIVSFTETLNKAFVVSGASAQEMSSAMYQLTQAMAAGKLQGDEFRSIRENAPMIAKSIEDYMRNVVKAEGTMKDWSAQGLLTTDVIRKAVFNASADINKKFKEFPRTFGQSMNLLKNSAIEAFEPINQKISEFLNSERVQMFIGVLIVGIESILGAINYLLNGIQAVWNFIEPYMITLTVVLLPVIIAQLGMVAAGWAVAAGKALLHFAIAVANFLLMNKWLLIIIGIVLIFVTIWKLMGATASDVITAIMIAISVLWGVCQNAFAAIYNIFVTVVHGLIKIWYEIFVHPMIKAIEWIVELMDKAFGTDLSSGVKKVTGLIDETINKEPKLMEMVSKEEMVARGIGWGDTVNNKLSSIGDKLSGIADNFSPDGLAVSGIADTVSVNGEMSITEEDLKLLKDVATTEFVNRFTTLRPTLNASFGDVRETADVEVIMDKIGDMMEEALAESLY